MWKFIGVDALSICLCSGSQQDILLEQIGMGKGDQIVRKSIELRIKQTSFGERTWDKHSSDICAAVMAQLWRIGGDNRFFRVVNVWGGDTGGDSGYLGDGDGVEYEDGEDAYLHSSSW